MKKTIFVLLLTIAAMTAFSQAEKKAEKKEVKQEQKAPADTLVIDATKVRFIKIGDQVHDLQTEIPIFLTLQYAVAAYNFFQHAKYPDASKDDVDALQSPFLPYWQYYQKQLQEQAKKK